MLSIGAGKGGEVGRGCDAALLNGSDNNDCLFYDESKKVHKYSNNSGGILGGISDGDKIVFRAAFKPTPSIATPQKTVSSSGENVEVETMTAITLLDLILLNMCSRVEYVKNYYENL